MKATLAALVLSVALAAAGCGSSSSKPGSGSSGSGGYAAPKQQTAPAPTASSSSGSTVAVTLQNIAFNPTTVHAKVGQTVTWTNKDAVPHNVTAKTGGSFRSSTLNQGQTYSFKPTKAGTITYVCTFHQGMTATLVVTK